MTLEKLANMETAELASILGVRVSRAMSKDGYMVHAVIMEGTNEVIAQTRPSRLRSFLIATVLDFEANGAFA